MAHFESIIRPLPSPRPRALTLPLPETADEQPGNPSPIHELLLSTAAPRIAWISRLGRRMRKVLPEVPQRSSDQFQSPLFRLPLEIRIVIWREVIGDGRIFHIRRWGGRLVHTQCISQSLSLKKCDQIDPNYGRLGACRVQNTKILKQKIGVAFIDMKVEEPTNTLGLVKSCRRIYTEAISFLYSLPLFQFSLLNTVSAFYRTTLPTRRHQITTMHLCFYIPAPVINGHFFYLGEDEALWAETFIRISAGFKGLQTLRVLIDDERPRSSWESVLPWRPDDGMARLLLRMAVVKHVDVFEVRVPWNVESMQGDPIVEMLPFKVLGLDKNLIKV